MFKFFKKEKYPYLLLTKNYHKENILELHLNKKESIKRLCSLQVGKVNLSFITNLMNFDIIKNNVYKNPSLIQTTERFRTNSKLKEIEELILDEYISFVDDNFNFVYLYKTESFNVVPSKAGIGIDKDFFEIIKENLDNLILKTTDEDFNVSLNICLERNIQLEKDNKFNTKICKCSEK